MTSEQTKAKIIKPEFYATKLYLTKLSEKYINRGYENIFLEKDNNYLEDVKEVIENINTQNSALDEIINSMAKTVQKISKLKNIDPEIKKLAEDNLVIFTKFMDFTENIIKNEDKVMETVDRFRKIEKEINIKSKALTKYWFDKEMSYIMDNLKDKKHKELTMIIFDMNNLKTLNETYWHQAWSESIIMFWSILKEELRGLWVKYLLSNYFGWDEWFLCLIDINMRSAISIVKKFFQNLKSNTYKIRDFNISMSACAWIVHYHPPIDSLEYIWVKSLINITDTLVLQSKIQKNRNKYGNAYKVVHLTNISQEEIQKLTKNIQTMPIKFKKGTLGKKKLIELFEIRRKQNEKIMRARTLWVKKILRYNIDIINELIGNKIIESISIVQWENKAKTFNKLELINKKLFNMAVNEIEKTTNEPFIPEEEREIIISKILKSIEFQKFSEIEIDSIYEWNILRLGNY